MSCSLGAAFEDDLGDGEVAVVGEADVDAVHREATSEQEAIFDGYRGGATHDFEWHIFALR